MDTYVTGSTIRLLREAKGLTQAELAGKLAVSAKTISNGRPPRVFPISLCWNRWPPRWASACWS